MKTSAVVWAVLLSLPVHCAMAQIKMASIDVAAWYSLIAVHSGKALEIQGGAQGLDGGRPLQQGESTGADNQLFQLKQIQSGYFEITAKSSGLVLEIKENSLKDHAPVQQNRASGKDNQLFALARDSDGSYAIIAKSSGYGFDVAGGVTALGNGVPVIVYPAGGAKNQRFRLVPAVNLPPAARTTGQRGKRATGGLQAC